MAIKLPSFGEDLQQSLPGLMTGLQTAVNPYMQQQMALRKAMVENPALAQHLADMGSSVVEQTYGRGTGGLTPNLSVSSARNNELAKQAAFAKMSQDPNSVESKDYKNNLLGLKTDAERAQQGATLANTQATTRHTGLASDELVRTEDDKKAAESHARMLLVKNKMDVYKDPFKLQLEGKITGADLAILMKDPNFVKLHDADIRNYEFKTMRDQQQQFHADTENRADRRQTYLENKADMRSAGLFTPAMQQKILFSKAVALGAKTGQDPNAIFQVMSDNNVYAKYTAPGVKPDPNNKDDVALYNAAQRIQDQRKRDGSEEMYKADEMFKSITKKDFDIIESTSNKVTDAMKAAAVNRIQVASKRYHGADAPVWKYDEGAGTGVDTHHWLSPNEKILYPVGGNPDIASQYTGYIPHEAPTQKKAPANGQVTDNPLVEAAAKMIISGQITENELKARKPKIADLAIQRASSMRPAPIQVR